MQPITRSRNSKDSIRLWNWKECSKMKGKNKQTNKQANTQLQQKHRQNLASLRKGAYSGSGPSSTGLTPKQTRKQDQ